MPTANVRTPDGRTMRLKVPEGATEQQILDFAKQKFQEMQQPPEQETQRTPPPMSQVGDVRFEGTNRPPGEPGIPLGLVGDETRGDVREFVEEQSFIDQLLLEASPATIGTAIGGGLGSLAGPAGTVGGAAIGGGLGELAAQEFGVTPRSDLALGLSAAAPVAGPVASAATRGIRGAAGRGLAQSPLLEKASSTLAARGAADEFTSLGGEILARQRGLKARTADELLNSARAARGGVQAGQLKNTTSALKEMEQELGKFSEFTDAQQAGKFIGRIRNTIEQGEMVDFDTLIELRKQIGAARKAFERAGGTKLRSAGKVFSALADDLDSIAQGSGPERRGARLIQSGFERARLENSVGELEEAVSQFTRLEPGDDIATLNVARLREWFRKATDPKSKQYNRNLTEALGDEVPNIKERLATLDKATEKAGRSAAGAGSLVIRGIGAGGGAAAGFAVAGPVGAGVGGIAGARLPEIMTAALLTKPGAQVLSRLASAGQPVNLQRSGLVTQLLTQAGLSSERQAPPLAGTSK